MTYRCEIDFKNECDIPKYAGYKKYHFVQPRVVIRGYSPITTGVAKVMFQLLEV